MSLSALIINLQYLAVPLIPGQVRRAPGNSVSVAVAVGECHGAVPGFDPRSGLFSLAFFSLLIATPLGKRRTENYPTFREPPPRLLNFYRAEVLAMILSPRAKGRLREALSFSII